MLTQENYNDRLNRMLDYVYAHQEDVLSFDRLAEIACLSPYHWSRIYSAMRGETIATTIRRLRLQRAAERLSNSDLDLETVATRAGYSSTDTFGRAFRDAFGLSPAAYRANGSHAAFKAANAASDASAFPVEIKTLPARRCAGVDHTGSYMQIDHAMGKLFTELVARHALPAEPAMIGLFFDDPDLGAEDQLRSRACLPVAETTAIDAPLVETNLRGGPYAILSYTGPYADMRSAYRWFLGVWLPASGRETDDAPIFEAYLNDPRSVPQSELRTDIHLPPQSRAMNAPPVPAPIALALSRYPDPVQARLLEIRALIFATAAETEGVGPLTETLKWGEPAYLTEASKSGTTIRLGSTKSAPNAGAVLFNCKTSLVETFRTHFAETFAFEDNRALIVPISAPLPQAPLTLCLRAALTYHRR